MKTRVTSKGQITIPVAIRERLDLRPGTVIKLDEKADRLKAVKQIDAGAMRSVIGIAKQELAGRSSSEWMDFLRGPVELPKPNK
jgi:antitoxin PrlF